MTKLYVVGAGSGSIEDFTIKAYKKLQESDTIFCDELMYTKIVDHFPQDKLIKNEYTKTKTRCLNAINSANNGLVTSILGSGDTGIYGISSIILEEVEKQNLDIEVEIIPGMTSLVSGASLLGSPLTKDFALISLSDNFANKESLATKIEAIAQTDLIIVFYSPSNPTKENLIMAQQILLKYRNPKTVIGIASHIGEKQETKSISNLELIPLDEIDSFSTIFIGNDTTNMTLTKKMVTPLTTK